MVTPEALEFDMLLVLLSFHTALADPPATPTFAYHTGGFFTLGVKGDTPWYDDGYNEMAGGVKFGGVMNHPWFQLETSGNIGAELTWNYLYQTGQFSPVVGADAIFWLANGPIGLGGQVRFANWDWSGWKPMVLADLGFRKPGSWFELHIVGSEFAGDAYYALNFVGWPQPL